MILHFVSIDHGRTDHPLRILWEVVSWPPSYRLQAISHFLNIFSERTISVHLNVCTRTTCAQSGHQTPPICSLSGPLCEPTSSSPEWANANQVTSLSRSVTTALFQSNTKDSTAPPFTFVLHTRIYIDKYVNMFVCADRQTDRQTDNHHHHFSGSFDPSSGGSCCECGSHVKTCETIWIFTQQLWLPVFTNQCWFSLTTSN